MSDFSKHKEAVLTKHVCLCCMITVWAWPAIDLYFNSVFGELFTERPKLSRHWLLFRHTPLCKCWSTVSFWIRSSFMPYKFGERELKPLLFGFLNVLFKMALSKLRFCQKENDAQSWLVKWGMFGVFSKLESIKDKERKLKDVCFLLPKGL